MSGKVSFCVALDIDEKSRFISVLKATCDYVDIYKVGPVSISSIGVESLELISDMGADIFLDMKFFDIPSVVARAMRNFCRFGKIKLFTVHVSAGEKVFKTAVDVARSFGAQVAGVTSLTSERTTTSIVLRLAEKALAWGGAWVVASAIYARKIKERLPINVLSPGIRPESEFDIDDKTSKDDDHFKSVTPRRAKELGVDMIVVGRPIILSENPREVARKICEEFSAK